MGGGGRRRVIAPAPPHDDQKIAEMIPPRMPTIMRIQPTVWMFIPLVCWLTANARIAPTAVIKMLTPSPMRKLLSGADAGTATIARPAGVTFCLLARFSNQVLRKSGPVAGDDEPEEADDADRVRPGGVGDREKPDAGPEGRCCEHGSASTGGHGVWGRPRSWYTFLTERDLSSGSPDLAPVPLVWLDRLVREEVVDGTHHLRVLIANQRPDRLELLASVVGGLGHEVIAREVEVKEGGGGPARGGP